MIRRRQGGAACGGGGYYGWIIVLMDFYSSSLFWILGICVSQQSWFWASFFIYINFPVSPPPPPDKSLTHVVDSQLPPELLASAVEDNQEGEEDVAPTPKVGVMGVKMTPKSYVLYVAYIHKDMIIWPIFKSKWWSTIAWGFVPRLRVSLRLAVNYHTSGYEVWYFTHVKMIQKVMWYLIWYLIYIYCIKKNNKK